MPRKRVGDRLVDVPDEVFACDFSDDPDPLARDMHEPALRHDYVCVDPPPVTEIRKGA